jgi:RNA polymerase sigma-70 factor (ECF subfamily)
MRPEYNQYSLQTSMLTFPRIAAIEFAGGDGKIIGGNVLGLFAREAHGDGGIRGRIVALYDELRPLLYNNLIFMGFDPKEVDDAIQEAFLRLLRQLAAGREVEDMRGWLFRAAYSLSLNVRRRERRIALQGSEAEDYVRQLPAIDANPEQEYLSHELMRRYEAAVERLTSQQRQCLLLRKEGLRYREIAAALGIGASRVPQLLERAVGRLVEELYG